MRVLLVAAALTAPLAALSAQAPDSLPEGVTATMIAQGRLLYEGPGRCVSCHGPDGAGITNAGSDLTDDTWTHTDGSFEEILALIKAGVPREHSESGGRMPERGASRLTENQLRAVAAYAWSLSRQSGGDR